MPEERRIGEPLRGGVKCGEGCSRLGHLTMGRCVQGGAVDAERIGQESAVLPRATRTAADDADKFTGRAVAEQFEIHSYTLRCDVDNFTGASYPSVTEPFHAGDSSRMA